MGTPERHGRRRWVHALAVVPGAALSLLPAASCPACLAAYAGVLSAAGLGFIADEQVLAPLIAVFLALGIASIAWSTRTHGRRGPLVATLLGSAAVVASRLAWNLPVLLYAGVALLVAASLWNLWLKRPRREALVQLGMQRKEGSS